MSIPKTEMRNPLSMNMDKMGSEEMALLVIQANYDAVRACENAAGEIAKALGNPKVLNTVVLGLAAKHIGFDKEKWVEVLASTVPQKTIEINTKAFNCGYDA